MRKLIGILSALGLVVAAPAGARSFIVNPQGGVVGSNFSTDRTDLTDEARLGYALGGQLRLGGRGYLAPGIYWQHTSLEATVVDQVTLDEVTDDLEVSSLHVPLQVGYNLSAAAGTNPGAVGFRVYGGPTMTIVTDVKPNAFLLTKDDYEDTILGAQVGAGLDLATLTVDANYEFGLSNVYRNGPDTKQNTARALVGIRF